MKPYRYIKLSDSDKLTIADGIKNGKTHHFRERCRAIELSDKGQKVPQIAFFLEKRCETIRHWFDKWEKDGISGLNIQSGRGLKPTLDTKDEELKAEIKKSKRTTA
jgi:transposase